MKSCVVILAALMTVIGLATGAAVIVAVPTFHTTGVALVVAGLCGVLILADVFVIAPSNNTHSRKSRR